MSKKERELLMRLYGEMCNVKKFDRFRDRVTPDLVMSLYKENLKLLENAREALVCIALEDVDNGIAEYDTGKGAMDELFPIEKEKD